jgi:hypothetical protein
MKKEELHLFARYYIEYDEGFKANSYKGEGILINKNPEGYEDGHLEFILPGEEYPAVFGTEDVKKHVKGPNFDEKTLDIILQALENNSIDRALVAKYVFENYKK